MSVRIRLRRIGKNPKRRCFFRIAVFSKKQSRDSRSMEELGYYDPTKKPELIKINKERLQYWLSCGAQMSETVKSLVNRLDKKSEVRAETEPEATTKTTTETEVKSEAKAEAKPETEVKSETEAKSETEDKTKVNKNNSKRS